MTDRTPARSRPPPARALCAALVAVLTAGACSSAPPEASAVEPAPAGEPWDRLSRWNLFSDIPRQAPQPGVFPYEVNSPLFADYAAKHRFIWLPDDTHIEFQHDGPWRFPDGSVLVKTFSYPDPEVDSEAAQPGRLLETRLLIRRADGWEAHTYVYDDDGLDATRKVAGTRISVRFEDGSGAIREGRYAVPNTNQCRECHGEEDQTDTLGGVTRQLNRPGPDGEGNQIERLTELGMLAGAEDLDPRALPALADPFGDAPLAERVRSYFDANCGHCHNDGEDSGDDGSGLWLRHDLTDPEAVEPATLGICKMPQSAGGATCGLSLDVVPGEPDASIMLCRMRSEDSEVQMPPLGRTIAHVEAAELISDWIESLAAGDCE